MSSERSYDRWDVALFIFCLGGSFFSLTAALSLAALGLVTFASGDAEGAQAVQWTSTGLFTLALMGVPPIISTGRTIFGSEAPGPGTPSRAWLALALLLPLGLLLGYLAYEESVLPALLGPAGQLLAVGTPAALLIVVLRREGPSLRPRRVWTHFLFGLWAVPVVALIVEAILLLMGALLGAAALSLTPGGRELIDRLEGLTRSFDPTAPPEALIEIVQHPVVVVGLLFYLAFLIPIVEETLKTAAIWPFLPGRLSPVEAFLGGALGGAGFALAEALFVTQPMAGWLVSAVARSGATLMHAMATGLACWGVAQAWSRRRWLQGIGALLTAMVLHGLWNASAVAIGLSQLPGDEPLAQTPPAIAIIGAAVLLCLTTFAVLGLPGFLRRARMVNQPPISAE